MASISKPRNDIRRLAVLRHSSSTGAHNHREDLFYISAQTLNEINRLLQIFDEAFVAMSAQYSERTREVAEAEAALDDLKACLRDFWEVLKRRVRRHKEPAGVLRFYNLPLDGEVPNPSSRDEWLELAALAIKGDAEAEEAGFATAVCPSAMELENYLNLARREISEVAPADQAYDRAQAAVASLREQVDELIDDIADELLFNLRKLDAASQRRVLRSYGFTFDYAPGEPVDPEDRNTEVSNE